MLGQNSKIDDDRNVFSDGFIVEFPVACSIGVVDKLLRTEFSEPDVQPTNVLLDLSSVGFIEMGALQLIASVVANFSNKNTNFKLRLPSKNPRALYVRDCIA